jgi:ATP-dependent protease ClpP protease subunit
MHNRNKRMDDDDLENQISVIGLQGGQSNRIKITPRQSREITIFMDDAIGQPNEYRDELYTILSASEEDDVQIILNTVGGNLSTALAFREALGVCNAQTTAIIMNECSSAGTILALSCQQVAVLDSAEFMIHTAKFGSGGNTNNVKDHVDFTHKQVTKLIEDTYAGFLTKAEIEQVKNGKEFWMDSAEIKIRLLNRTKHHESLQKKEIKKEKQSKKVTDEPVTEN